MIGVGERVPEATVWTAPRAATSLSSLLAEGPTLLFFYLFDWSST